MIAPLTIDDGKELYRRERKPSGALDRRGRPNSSARGRSKALGRRNRIAVAVFHDQHCMTGALTALSRSYLDLDRVGFFACRSSLERIIWASTRTGWPRRLGVRGWQVVLPWRDPVTRQVRGIPTLFQQLPVYCRAGLIIVSRGWPLLDCDCGSAGRIVSAASYLARFIVADHASRLARAVDNGGVLLGIDLDGSNEAARACRALLAHNDDRVEVHDFRLRSLRRFPSCQA